MRLLIIIALVYLGYRVIKPWVFKNFLSVETDSKGYSKEIDDVMIKDPVCEVYFPKREGIHLKHKGQDLYFCSDECKNKYIQSDFEDHT